MSRAWLWQQQGKIANARQLLAETFGWFTEGFDVADLRDAKMLFGAFQPLSFVSNEEPTPRTDAGKKWRTPKRLWALPFSGFLSVETWDVWNKQSGVNTLLRGVFGQF